MCGPLFKVGREQLEAHLALGRLGWRRLQEVFHPIPIAYHTNIYLQSTCRLAADRCCSCAIARAENRALSSLTSLLNGLDEQSLSERIPHEYCRRREGIVAPTRMLFTSVTTNGHHHQATRGRLLGASFLPSEQSRTLVAVVANGSWRRQAFGLEEGDILAGRTTFTRKHTW